MDMRGRIIAILLIVFSSYAICSNGEIDYTHKQLNKALEKLSISLDANIVELDVDDSIYQKNHVKGKYFQVIDNESHIKYIYIGRVNSCRAGGCSISNTPTSDSNSEYFDYFILFDKNSTVQSVKVFNYQATHGHEITAKGWLKQFMGYNTSAEPLKVEKNIDAISGATISVYAITFDIEIKTQLLTELIN